MPPVDVNGRHRRPVSPRGSQPTRAAPTRRATPARAGAARRSGAPVKATLKRQPVAKRQPVPKRQTPAKRRPTTRALPRTKRQAPRDSEWVLLIGLVAMLALIGLVMVLSASSDVAIRQGVSPWSSFIKQVLWVTLGGLSLAFFTRVDYRFWRRFALPGVLAVSAMLLVVLVPGIGVVTNGSRRWLGVGAWNVQPSEVAKLAVVLFAADLLARREDRMYDTRFTFRPVAIVVVFVAALVMKQPDMGTTIVICAAAVGVLYVAGTPIRTLGLGLGALGGMGALLGIVAPYRMKRLLSFLHPLKDNLNTGYQAVQGRVGMATGKWFGVGLGAGRVKTGYLPNANTDFIFAVIGEELGFVGCVVVVVLFATLAYLGIRAAARAPDRFGMLLAAGVTTWLIVQALVNVGAVIGLLPVTGVPLPFVSFGGSSMVIAMGAVGMLANVARQAQ